MTDITDIQQAIRTLTKIEDTYNLKLNGDFFGKFNAHRELRKRKYLVQDAKIYLQAVIDQECPTVTPIQSSMQLENSVMRSL